MGGQIPKKSNIGKAELAAILIEPAFQGHVPPALIVHSRLAFVICTPARAYCKFTEYQRKRAGAFSVTRSSNSEVPISNPSSLRFGAAPLNIKLDGMRLAENLRKRSDHVIEIPLPT